MKQWTKQENKKGVGIGNCFCQTQDTLNVWIFFFLRSLIFHLGVGLEKQELCSGEETIIISRLRKLGQWLHLVRNQKIHWGGTPREFQQNWQCSSTQVGRSTHRCSFYYFIVTYRAEHTWVFILLSHCYICFVHLEYYMINMGTGVMIWKKDARICNQIRKKENLKH